MACQSNSMGDYTKAEKAIIDYLEVRSLFQPIYFEPLDTVFVKDTLHHYISHLQEELIMDSLIYKQAQISYERCSSCQYIPTSCGILQGIISNKISLERKELDSLKIILPTISETVIAYYLLTHRFKYHEVAQPLSIVFALDTNLEVIESQLLESITGKNSLVTIHQKAFYDEHNKRICEGRLISKLRFDNKLLPLNEPITLKVKPGVHIFSWERGFVCCFKSFSQKVQIAPNKHYTFIGMEEGIYLENETSNEK